MTPTLAHRPDKGALYTDDQRTRRDAMARTTLQAVLAPARFLVFLVSLLLVARFLLTGDGYMAAMLSILVKTGFLYLIMITGAIWEKVVLGQWLFAGMLALAAYAAYLVDTGQFLLKRRAARRQEGAPA
ncbi:2-vinyl bacteriochlorophyllide hydratase [Roseovarius sp. SYSU LYC5161]|uniref:2-vinyl bacteriochlorophyllide hydratase n=1 Tax=Roseovarius halophilus (ex Wu et al. 2025) TaxID=3376060 RepID=UPI002870D3ED|nr:2-vinyl bacteriochlorophyllide hydratase [Roseovarius sp.]